MMPASQSFLPNIVPLAVLGDAVAINSSAFQLANIVGPSLGGLVYAYGESSKSAPGVPNGSTAARRPSWAQRY